MQVHGRDLLHGSEKMTESVDGHAHDTGGVGNRGILEV